MASKFNKKISAYLIAYKMSYRNVSIFPKILEEKKQFTDEEKKHLTRKGFRWYVYYDFLSPAGKYVRQTPVTEGINRNFPNFDNRLFAIKHLKSEVENLLNSGHSPYDVEETKSFTIKFALDFAVELKKNEVGDRTYKRYKGTVKALNEWLDKSGYSTYPVEKADKKLLGRFLNYISGKTSNRTRNNYRSDLSAVFGVLFQQEYVRDNPALKIENLKTAEKRDPTYTDKQVDDIMAYLLKNDKQMHVYISMVSYMFWRPIENCRLKVKDINLEERKINTFVKQGKNKTKLIPELLIEDLKEYLKGSDPEDYVFTLSGSPGKWDSDLEVRRRYFTGKYRKLKKVLGLDAEYTIYSFRHTFVTRAFKNLLEETKSEEQAIYILSKITGHGSKAIREYIHFIDASLPEDYSKYLK